MFIGGFIMSESRKKILLFNQHFAYLNRRFYEQFLNEFEMIDFTGYIKTCAKKQFGVILNNVDDVKQLNEEIEAYNYDSPSDWLREKMRSSLGISGYRYYIDELLCLDDIKTKEDISDARKKGYNVICTAKQWTKKFPLLDTKKVFYDKTILGNTFYYDKEKYAMVEVYGGYPTEVKQEFENYTIMPLESSCDAQQSILHKIDFIYETLKEGNYEYYTFLNARLYRNEIIDNLIRNTTDKEVIRELRRCQQDIFD